MLSCPICLEPATAAWTSPCGHAYCYACIAEWVRRRQHTCPICRARLPPSTLSPPPRPALFALTWVNPTGVRQPAFVALHLALACLAMVFFHTLRPATAPTTLVLDGLLLTTSLSTMGQILLYLVCNVSREWGALQHKLELRQSAATRGV
ncbi:hypothetical protein SPRG_11898 [Saprolegnia parasitica CBS 223.65]|uniref:RING-type domain-containing protein n=1 Tax=Saprolegnia parasitica (strain CBS 223.65) TaxID=695850 RepID=A0A067C922_SAPPC|nr:hypothetical protein SPRG_11898 [Saprolegnia parasitica CBS 223.65]KDO23051.1 hypothetical protein SPRG_11898 [Saprolegnia parasitica CBS 223.65]|eukprot:XP_012206168.1 hypothetical protein SPRG_11898 [Saprolegnia parasitica CBS 223.65]